ncbi:ABC transporter ATP-binding protein [Cellulomonas chengniuliangii]|uniref:ABC transporter ATP-binding protein/permease n=1 Tax=Cellulomonas chengniuliangii TaxID=2968084 RepID=A0ABY5L3F1_9CELL|nr:ABC transporter ATP-binding protein [Cellulomonas chengniuliangii]MCC2308181.1 ABC transporter ATP-binding protein/permease [Cellulomonas chengniuliangii]UUI76573.1 ABC transporter ATP-binding protein/permease [Cellulomonas chengniuliangii]
MPARPAPPRQVALTGSLARRSVLLLWRGIASQPRTYVLAIGASAVFGASTVAVSTVLGIVTDDVVVPALGGSAEARSRIWLAGLALAAVAVTLALSVAGRRVFAGIGVADQQAGFRTRVTRQYLRLPLPWHRRHPTGQLLSNANADVEAATSVFNPLPFALGVVVMIGVAAVQLLRTDLWLALAALVVLPLALAANVVFERKMSPAVTRAQQLRAEVSDIAHESFEGALLVKSLGAEDREERRFTASAQTLRDANIRVGVIRAFFDPVIDMLPGLGTLLVLLVGTVRAADGAVGPGDIVSAAYLLTLMAVPVRAFGWVLGDLPRTLVGHDRVARVLDARSTLEPGDGTLEPSTAGARVTLRDVGVSVPVGSGSAELLTGVDLELAPGRTVALVGPTGAGKTTLASMLSRLVDPSSGVVEIDGHDLRTLRADAITSQVALVAQTTFVFEDTVRANVTLADVDEPGAPNDDEVWAALRLARVDDVVRALPGGLDAPLGERGSNLSGGQRQRLALARALVRRPRLLVLDDATSAVDPGVEQQILTGLRAGATPAGTAFAPTVLMVAYRMSSVSLADEVVHLEGGKVVDRGTHAELLARDPGYRELATAYEQETARRAAELDDAAADQTTGGGR